MVQCSGCGFGVNDLMKFALMNNTCPSCGKNLFSNKDTNVISMIQGKLASERFSSKFTEELLYDVSLFIFNELKHGIGKALRDELRDEEVEETAYQEEEDVDEEELIRREIEREYGDELSHLAEVTEEDGDIFTKTEKAEKLKKLREQQLMNNPNFGQPPAKKPGGKSVLKSGPKVSRVT